MIKQTSSSAPLAKIQSIIFLGLGCNSTTLIGCIAVWVALSKIGALPFSYIDTALLIFSFAPIFMADALSIYVLGRIKLEYENDWDDVLITEKARETTNKLYKVYRALSIIPSYLLAAVFVASKAGNEQLYNNLLIAFIVAFIIQFIRTISFIQLAIAPVKEGFGGANLIKRSIIALAMFSGIIWWLKSYNPNYTNTYIFSTGIIYFALSSMIQPLPTQFSLLPRRREIHQVYDSDSPGSFSILVQNGNLDENEADFPQPESLKETSVVEEAEIVEETNG